MIKTNRNGIICINNEQILFPRDAQYTAAAIQAKIRIVIKPYETDIITVSSQTFDYPSVIIDTSLCSSKYVYLRVSQPNKVEFVVEETFDGVNFAKVINPMLISTDNDQWFIYQLNLSVGKIRLNFRSTDGGTYEVQVYYVGLL